MKTKSQNTKPAPGLRVQSSNHQETPAAARQKPERSQINFNRRETNRSLNTEKLLALLHRETPDLFELAEVVGHWVWIQFTERQPGEVTRALSQLGFHWNRDRQAWQHPCGKFCDGASPNDPRSKYGSYFAAEKAA